MTLQKYIERYGDAVCSEKWGIKLRTVAAYRRRERFPSRRVAIFLIENSDGELSMEGVFNDSSDLANDHEFSQ